MLIYIEEDILNFPLVQKNLKRFYNADKIIIRNYKNIFDKKIPLWKIEKLIIFAKIRWSAISYLPDNYWHEKISYSLKTSLNCIFDCAYCYLKWAFENNFQVYFLNYDDIKKEVLKVVNKFNNSYPLWFYSSDYSDILWMNDISWFVEEFVPFFEQFDNVMLEIRTKSVNIKSLLDLWFVPKNTEIAFSLNPQELISKYEKWVANLHQRICAINLLLDKWFKIWLRFLPLLPVKNYQEIYSEFINYVKNKIDIEKVYSIFVSGLLYTKDDYFMMLKKNPYLDILYYLKENEDWLVREKEEFREFFYKLFNSLTWKCKISLDNISCMDIN